MKFLFSLAVLMTSVLVAPSGAEDDHRMRADVKDSTDTLTRVTNLSYCFEEPEGDRVYINKYDNFFVQQGEAVIKVDFNNISSVIFHKGVIEESGQSVRKAVIRTRSGKRYDTSVLCHSDCFLQGDVELGEFRIDFVKVREITFSAEGAPEPEGFEVRLSINERAPEGMLPLILLADGSLRIDDFQDIPKEKLLHQVIEEKKGMVFLRAKAELKYPVLMRQLKQLRDAGARIVVFKLE